MPGIHAIYRYPIKGLSPELLLRVELTPGETIPGDRLYAIENGLSGFNPAAPAYLSKTHFLMLMKNARLASLRTSFDQTAHRLTIETVAREQKISADLRTTEGRAVIERFLPIIAPASCGGRRESCMLTAIAFPTSPARWYRSSIWLRSQPLRT